MNEIVLFCSYFNEKYSDIYTYCTPVVGSPARHIVVVPKTAVVARCICNIIEAIETPAIRTTVTTVGALRRHVMQ